MRKVLLALLIAITSRVLADETKEWMVWLPGKLIRWAAKQFQDDYRARIEEEWLAHSDDLPGNFGKVWHALGCVATAFKVTDALSRSALVIIVVPIVEIEAPLVVCVLLLVESMGLFDVGEEQMRSNRLRRAAGGLTVLGLKELELTKSDYHRYTQVKSLTEGLLGMGLIGQVMESSARRAVKRWMNVAEEIGFLRRDL